MPNVTITVGRITLGGPPTISNEQVGDPISNMGGGIVPAQRSPLSFQIALATWKDATDTLPGAQALRRRLRSMLNNNALKLQAYLYVTYSDDTEFNGWYIPDQSTLQGLDNTAWKAVGLWVYQGGKWSLAGHLRTNREARQVWAKTLANSAYPRDILGSVLLNDFGIYSTAGDSPLWLTYLPDGLSGALGSASGQGYAPTLTSAKDLQGYQTPILSNLPDLTAISFERADAILAAGPGDVVAYDRRGGYTIQTGMVRASASYSLQETDLGVIAELVGSTMTLPINVAGDSGMADAPISYIVKNATTGSVTVSTGTTGVIDNYSGGINATSTTVVAGESLIFIPAPNLLDWISV